MSHCGLFYLEEDPIGMFLWFHFVSSHGGHQFCLANSNCQWNDNHMQEAVCKMLDFFRVTVDKCSNAQEPFLHFMSDQGIG